MKDALDEAIRAGAEGAFGFLERLVQVPSVVGAEQPALEIFSAEMEALGLDVARLPFANGPVDDSRAGVAPNADRVSDGRYQVLATTLGEGPLHLLLNGHMDVVPAEPASLWTSPPFSPQRRGGHLYGRGAGDMKSGFAVGALALRAVNTVAPGLFARRRLGFLAVIEEECTGNGTLRSIVEEKVVAPEVVVLEPTDLGLLLGGTGVMWLEISVFSHAGHAQDANRPATAVDLGLKLVARLRQWSNELWHDEPEPGMPADINPYNFNLGKLNAGDWLSTVPAAASFGVRIGFPRSWMPMRAEQEARQLIADFAMAEGFPMPPQVVLTGFRAEGYLQDEAAPLVRDLAAAHFDAHGAPPSRFMLGSTTDARYYVNQAGVAAVCYGATAVAMHGIDESVELQSIVDAARTLARFLLMRFAEGEPG